MHLAGEIDTLVEALATCEYNATSFREILDEIQTLVHTLDLHSYTNFVSWVMTVDAKVDLLFTAAACGIIHVGGA